MSSKFWRETPPSGAGPDRRKKRTAGSVTLIAVFVSFLFSSIGLGLVCLTRIYRQWSMAKSDSVLLATAAENGVREGFGALAATLTGRSFPLSLTEEEYETLRASARAGGLETVEMALGFPLPLSVEGAGGSEEWSAEVGFTPEHIADAETFFGASYTGTIASRGRLTGRSRTKRTGLEIGLSVLAGCLPLSAFPFLLAGKNGPEQAAALFADHRVVLTPPEGGGGRVPAAATEKSLIPSNAVPLLAEALKIKIFSPADLSAARIRQALGLPPSNEAVPDGVYLVVDDLGLGGIFVQGDVEEMVLAVDNGRQHLQFRLEEGTWRIWFDPKEPRTEFFGPEGPRSYALRPRPMVLVNGSIASLGGGTVDGFGNLTLSAATDTPAVLAGVSLTIVSSGETVISSHLIQEGIRWSDGLPYLKDSTSQLFLFAAGSDFLTGAKTDGKVRTGATAPADLYLQASIAAKDGFRLEGTNRNVILSGSLQAGGLEAGSNRLSIRPDDRLLSTLQSPPLFPRSTAPVLFLTGWETLQWTDR